MKINYAKEVLKKWSKLINRYKLLRAVDKYIINEEELTFINEKIVPLLEEIKETEENTKYFILSGESQAKAINKLKKIVNDIWYYRPNKGSKPEPERSYTHDDAMALAIQVVDAYYKDMTDLYYNEARKIVSSIDNPLVKMENPNPTKKELLLYMARVTGASRTKIKRIENQ